MLLLSDQNHYNEINRKREDSYLKTPLYDGIKKVSKSVKIDFQFPGHRKKTAGFVWKELLPDFDTTETYGTDNLHFPVGIIEQSLEEAAKAYGAKHSIYIVNGSTGANHIAFATLTKPGDKVLIQRNSHISTYNAAIVNQLNCEYILPTYDQDEHIIGGIDVEEFEKKLASDPDIKMVALLNPSFYGICSDIERIVEIAHAHDVSVLVDEAHGTHLAFSNELPKSAIRMGADMVVQSIHKTLPALTQTAILHVGTDRVELDKLQAMSRMFQTTSPSYIFMISIEQAIAFMTSQEGQQRMKNILAGIRRFEQRIESMENAYVYNKKSSPNFVDRDPMKLIVGVNGLTGTELLDKLHDDYEINLEYADYYHAIGIVTLMNDPEELDVLADAIEKISKEVDNTEVASIHVPVITPNVSVGISEAFHSDFERVPLTESIGRISASYINPYPPGIPQLAPGEVITEELLELVRILKEKKITIVGLQGPKKDMINVMVR